MGSKNLKRIAAIVSPLFLAILFFYSPANNMVLSESNKQEILNKFYSLEIPFLENQGEIKDASVKYYARTLGAGFFITKDGQIAYSLTKSDEGKGVKILTTKESMTGVFPFVAKSEETSTVKINEFIGNEPGAWRIDIPGYNQISLGEVWSGIELELRAYGGGLEKIFSVKPKAAPETIRLTVEGVKASP
jgi:hypothetical protein